MSYTLLSNYHENGAALGVSVGLAASAIASMAYSRMLNIGITMNDVRKLFIEIRLSSTVVLINNLLLPFSLLLSANLLASNGDLRQVGILNFSYSIFALTLFAANALTAKDISEPSHLPAADTVQLLKFIIEKIVRNLSFLSISFAAVLLISASIFLSSGSAIISQSWQTSATFFLVGIIFCIQLPITTLLYQSGKEVHLLIASIVWFAVVIGLTTMVQVQSAQTVGLIYAIGYTVYLSIVGYMFYLNQFEK